MATDYYKKWAAWIDSYRAEYGNDICTDIQTSSGIARFTFCPGCVTGYRMEIDLSTGRTRHKGLGPGCFWTEWE